MSSNADVHFRSFINTLFSQRAFLAWKSYKKRGFGEVFVFFGVIGIRSTDYLGFFPQVWFCHFCASFALRSRDAKYSRRWKIKYFEAFLCFQLLFTLEGGRSRSCAYLVFGCCAATQCDCYCQVQTLLMFLLIFLLLTVTIMLKRVAGGIKSIALCNMAAVCLRWWKPGC